MPESIIDSLLTENLADHSKTYCLKANNAWERGSDGERLMSAVFGKP